MNQMKQKLYITIDKKIKEKLKNISAKQRRSMSNMIEYLIQQFKE